MIHSFNCGPPAWPEAKALKSSLSRHRAVPLKKADLFDRNPLELGFGAGQNRTVPPGHFKKQTKIAPDVIAQRDIRARLVPNPVPFVERGGLIPVPG